MRITTLNTSRFTRGNGLPREIWNCASLTRTLPKRRRRRWPGWMRANPDAQMFFIGRNSDTSSYCRCENCEAARKRYGGWDGSRRVAPEGLPDGWWNAMGGLAGLKHTVCQRIASILEKEFPNNKIGTFAYEFTRRPPRNIKAHKNVVVWFCPIERCFCHPIDRGPINDVFYNHPSEITSGAE